MIIVVAHGDLDGLASAAIVMAALKRRGERVSLEIAQPYSLARTLLKLGTQRPRMVVITDLGVDSATWHTLENAVKDLVSQGCRILWIDHHPGTVKRAVDLTVLGVSLLYTGHGSASTIARDAFVESTDDPAFYSKLARLGEISDGVAEGDAETTILTETLSTALSAPSSKEEFKKFMVKMWVEEKTIISDDLALLAEEFERALADKLRVINERIVLEVKKGIVIDARDVKLGGLAGHLAASVAHSKRKVTVLLFAPSEQSVVATCRVPRDLDFDALKELVPAAIEYGGGGGGHPKAAALRVPAAAGDALLQKVCEIIRRVLD